MYVESILPSCFPRIRYIRGRYESHENSSIFLIYYIVLPADCHDINLNVIATKSINQADF
jgi:hypothetical protein